MVLAAAFLALDFDDTEELWATDGDAGLESEIDETIVSNSLVAEETFPT